jgi:hypothetical protein
MRVDWATPCRYAEVNDGLFTIVGGGIDTYSLPAFPAELMVTILMRLASEAHEAGADHGIVITVLDPDMMPTTEDPLEATFHFENNPNAQEGWEQQLFIPLGVRFPAAKPGVYTIDIAVDGHSHTVALNLLQAH